MPSVMKLIHLNINNCYNGYELRGSMGNRQASDPVMNGDAQCHLTRSSRNRYKEPLTVDCNGYNSVSVRSDGVLVEKDLPGRLCRSKSKSCPGNGIQLGSMSPADGIRPRRNIWKLPSCLLGTTAEDNHTNHTPGRTNNIALRSKSDSDTIKSDSHKTEPLKSNSLHPLKMKYDRQNSHEQEADDKKKPKGDKKFLEDNKEYYKVELFNSKLRTRHQDSKHPIIKTEMLDQNGDLSNQSFDSDWEFSTVRKTRQSLADPDKSFLGRKTLNLRSLGESQQTDNETTPVKKSRSCMLEVLNMEAEKFMFGDPRRELEEQEEEDSSPEIVTPKRKRKSQAELFLIDNLDYYKFELPASRLRNGQDSKIYPKVQTKESESIPKILPAPVSEPRQKDIRGVIRVDFDEIKYSFQLGLEEETWFKVFLRSRSRWKQTLWQNRVPQQSKIILPFERKSKPEPPRIKQQPAPVFPPPPPPPEATFRRRKRRLSSILEDDKPRKSPRCHASTQAILSSQVGGPKSRSQEHVALAPCVPVPEEEESALAEFNKIPHDFTMFPECCEFSRNNPYSVDLKKLVEKLTRQCHLPSSQLNVCEILREYSRSYHYGNTDHGDNSSEFGGSSNLSMDGTNTTTGRKLRQKKRRINMTGWPCRPKRKVTTKIATYCENSMYSATNNRSLDLESNTSSLPSSTTEEVVSCRVLRKKKKPKPLKRNSR